MDMQSLSDRQAQLIATITETVMGSAERIAKEAEETVRIATDAGCERIALATEFAQLRTGLEIRAAKIAMMADLRAKLIESRDAASDNAMKAFYDAHIDIYTGQQERLLKDAGVPADKVAAALAATQEKLYVRRGRPFKQLNGDGGN